MIATFRNESRRTVWFAVAVAAVALVTLTDANATADEPKRTFKRVLLDVSPEGQAFIAQLEGKMTLTLDNATIEEIINAVSNATGASIKVAEGAFTEATRDARLKLTAKNIPAHIVLNESLSAVGLGLRFAEDGITVVTLPEDHERTAEVFIRKMEGAPAAAGEPRRFRVIQGDEIELQNGERVIVKQRKLNRAEANVEATTDGVQRRKVKLTDENNVEGTLEIEVKK